MRKILTYLRDYSSAINKPAFLLTSLLLCILIYINYSFGIESGIRALASPSLVLPGFFFLYAFTFGSSYWLSFLFNKQQIPTNNFFWLLLILAPLMFAIKNGWSFPESLTSHLRQPWNRYWPRVIDWPLKTGFITLVIFIIWRWGRYEGPIAGTGKQGQSLRPYFILLAMMIPILLIATFLPGFQQVYPKLKAIAFINPHLDHTLPWKLLYEISYGIDFFTIELFFRGFLVLAFLRYAGVHAILPMAAFYCTIHFGKPLPECITSYFGGLILGAIVYNTKSIRGGLLIHLGIAWMMELLGYLRDFI